MKCVARANILFVLCLLMLIGGLSEHVLAEDPVITTGDFLNEFDLANYCVGIEYTAPEKFNEIRYGYTTLLNGQNRPEFIYLTSRYYVPIEPYGDPGKCEFHRYLYRLGSDNRFKGEEITDEVMYSKLRASLSAYKQSNAKRFYDYKASRPEDPVGGCLFPIHWSALGGDDYALFSLADGIVGYVIPHYLRALDGNPSQCFAWGERHLTNESIVSDDITAFSFDDDRLFVALEDFQIGLLYQKQPDFQCVGRTSAFSHHIFVKRKFFDAQIRPRLEEIYNKEKPATGSQYPDGSAIISFVDSVHLNQEFANVVAGLAKKSGCD